MKSKETLLGYGTILGLGITFLQTIFFIYAYYNKPKALSTTEIGIVITIIAVHIVSFTMVLYVINLTKKQDELLRDKELAIINLESKKNELEQIKESFTSLAISNHNINHSIRQIYSKLYNNILGISETYNDIDDDIDDVLFDKTQFNLTKSSYKEFLQYFTTNIKEFYDVYTNDSCAVYLTLITDQLTDSDNYYVKTYYIIETLFLFHNVSI